MKKLFYLAAFAGLISTGCRKIEVDGGTTVVNPPGGGDSTTDNPILEGRISANKTLKAGTVYKLRGLVYVTSGAILTIEPGTKIVGELNKQGGLIITRSSKIIADGTADKPIVFTSEASTPARGDWAGLVILSTSFTRSSSLLYVHGIADSDHSIMSGFKAVAEWLRSRSRCTRALPLLSSHLISGAIFSARTATLKGLLSKEILLNVLSVM